MRGARIGRGRVKRRQHGSPIVDAAALLRDARRLVVLSGAGLSTESGVPDFRSPGGVWSTFDPDEFHYHRFLADPARFWRNRAKLMEALDLAHARPNAAHEALAAASRSDRYLGHVTQNVDGLLHAAAHAEEKIVEVHGNARSVRCVACLRFFPYETAREAVEKGVLPPPCPSCAGVLKPGTVLFGEAMPEEAFARAERWARECDTLLVVGSSLVVYPVAALPQVALARGARLLLINEAPTPYDAEADAVLRGRAGRVLPDLLRGAGFLPT